MSHPHHEDSKVHLLSKKSRRLRRDTFFFMREFTGLHVLIAGLNQRLTPVTCAKLNRWVHFMGKRAFDFELEPVELARSGAVLKYSRVMAGSNVPPESNVPLPAGDYVWHVIVSPEMESSYMPPFSTFLDAATFAELQSGAQVPGELAHLKEQLSWYHFPSLLEKQVATRDDEHCLITGSRSDNTEICVTWIVPPAWVNWLDNPQYYGNPSSISIPSNAISMRKDLIDGFHDNAFGIDVDDNYRVVMFRDIGPPGALLQTETSQAYFRRSESQVQLVGPDDYFLREHFKHCLRVHLLHGEISADYPPNAVVKAMADLGLWEKDDEVAPFTDPRWQTELGKEIFASHFQYQADTGLYEQTTEDDEE